MNPFNIPISGVSSWVELLLVVGGGLVMLIYVYQVFLPKIRDVVLPQPDYEERAEDLLRHYQQQKAEEDVSEP